jgi:hypothetical protein
MTEEIFKRGPAGGRWRLKEVLGYCGYRGHRVAQLEVIYKPCPRGAGVQSVCIHCEADWTMHHQDGDCLCDWHADLPF